VDVVGDGFSVDAGPEEQWNRYQEDRQDCLTLFGCQQAFVEALLDHPIPQWHPYDAVAVSDNPADLAHVRRECPVE
jgi:hypothetical protein